MEENYLARWLDGQLEGDELREFESSPEFAAYERIKSATEDLQIEVDFRQEEVWAAVRARRSQFESNQADVASEPIEDKVRPLYSRSLFLRVAASVAILLAVSYFAFRGGETRLTTANGERELATLPDASRVTLNAGSKLSFDGEKWETERRVALIGEAFFDVARGKTFTVSTALGEVRVLGTQFDVLQRGDLFRVQCYEGKVAVSYRGQEFVLLPGQALQVVQGEGVWQFAHERQEAGWMARESTFRSVPLGHVIEELGRQYNVRIALDQVPVDKKFTGSFRHDDLRQALDYISKPTKLTYSIEKGQVRLYGANDGQGK